MITVLIYSTYIVYCDHHYDEHADVWSLELHTNSATNKSVNFPSSSWSSESNKMSQSLMIILQVSKRQNIQFWYIISKKSQAEHLTSKYVLVYKMIYQDLRPNLVQFVKIVFFLIYVIKKEI